MKLFRNSRGDTIVEVLIALAIASFAIGGAYVVVNSTLANSQEAQEHTEALQLANAQLEQLKGSLEDFDKACAADPGVCSLSAPTTKLVFCFSQTGAMKVFSGATALPATEGSYPAECKGFGLGQFMRIAVLYDNKGTNNAAIIEEKLDDSYTVFVNWIGPSGSNQQVSLSYKAFRL